MALFEETSPAVTTDMMLALTSCIFTKEAPRLDFENVTL